MSFFDISAAAPTLPPLLADWLAAGINPGSAKIFIQSQVPEHAELHLLLSMITPLGWLERVPTYKDQQENAFSSHDDLLSMRWTG